MSWQTYSPCCSGAPLSRSGVSTVASASGSGLTTKTPGPGCEERARLARGDVELLVHVGLRRVLADPVVELAVPLGELLRGDRRREVALVRVAVAERNDAREVDVVGREHAERRADHHPQQRLALA